MMTLFIMEDIQEDFKAGDPFDYSCLSIDTNMNVNWIKHYGENPRGYSLNHIRNELYGIKGDWNRRYIYVWRNW